jgi:hypothetical protein
MIRYVFYLAPACRDTIAAVAGAATALIGIFVLETKPADDKT